VERPNPGADEAAGEQVDNHEPVADPVSKGDGHQTSRQGGHDQYQAHRLVHDHGLQGREADNPGCGAAPAASSHTPKVGLDRLGGRSQSRWSATRLLIGAAT
jgi:hypothetical protein